MMKHIENSGIVRTVSLDMFRYSQGHSAIFSHVQTYRGSFRYIAAYSSTIETYCDIQNSGIFRTLFRYINAYSSIFSLIKECSDMLRFYQGILTPIQAYSTHCLSLSYSQPGHIPSPSIPMHIQNCVIFMKIGKTCVILEIQSPNILTTLKY